MSAALGEQRGREQGGGGGGGGGQQGAAARRLCLVPPRQVRCQSRATGRGTPLRGHRAEQPAGAVGGGQGGVGGGSCVLTLLPSTHLFFLSYHPFLPSSLSPPSPNSLRYHRLTFYLHSIIYDLTATETNVDLCSFDWTFFYFCFPSFFLTTTFFWICL